MGKACWTWKLFCWIIVACAALAFYLGVPGVTVVLGLVAVLLFVVDFRVTMSEHFRESAIGRIAREEGGPATRLIIYLAFGVALLLAAQLVTALAARTDPMAPVSRLCFVCNR
ncbi:hypothetical protein [Paraburkholderia sp.]|uniref:hypothetical protein n=1 Tax=Paraburkholderia sp. TaxID=1926495 RepID=UPI003C7B65D9